MFFTLYKNCQSFTNLFFFSYHLFSVPKLTYFLGDFDLTSGDDDLERDLDRDDDLESLDESSLLPEASWRLQK